MRGYALFAIFIFSTLAFADDTPPEQKEPPRFDSRCVGPLEYTSQMIQAREGGISEDDLINDIMTAELAGLLNNVPQGRVFQMMEIIHMVYDEEVNLDSIEGVQNIYLTINDWCSGQLPPEKLEDRRWYDEDGDGFPDYDGDGEPIIPLEA